MLKRANESLGQSWDLLLRACCHDGAAKLDEIGVAPLCDHEFRMSFLGRARRHGVLGLALSTLQKAAAFDELPAEVKAELQSQLRSCQHRATIWVMERDRLTSLLAGHKLRPVVLKGAGLCTTVYSLPVERQFGDIDLLLEPGEIDGAVQAVAEAGYEKPAEEIRQGYFQHHFHLQLQHVRGFVLELHWGLVRPSSFFSLDPLGFIRQSSTVGRNESVPIRVPCREHQLLHLVGQNIVDRFASVARIVDLDRIVRSTPELDWSVLLSEAQKGGMSYALALSLQIARRLFGTPVPVKIVERLRPPPLVRHHLRALQPEASLLEHRFQRSWALSQLLDLWLRTDGRRRLRWLQRLKSGQGDPLAWVWTGEGPDTMRRAGVRARLTAFTKLTIVQAALNLRAMATAVTRLDGRNRRFWVAGRLW
jgi:hypothetical protein